MSKPPSLLTTRHDVLGYENGTVANEGMPLTARIKIQLKPNIS